ncbi:unnamed protein product [Sympodiomycopsis kandeliae]
MSYREKPGVEAGSVIPYLFQIGGNAAFAAVYGTLMILHFVRFFIERRQGRKDSTLVSTGTTSHKWSLTLPIAEIFMMMGTILRIVNRSHQQGITLYAINNLFVILSPTAFIGFVYMMYGRLVASIDLNLPEKPKVMQRSPLSFLPPRLVGRIFIASDITCFLIQATGGGLQATGDKNAVTGNNIFLAGVCLQLVCYALFCVSLVVTHRQIARQVQPFTIKNIFGKNVENKTSRLIALMYFASLCILIRSFFRVAEMGQGWDGKLYNTEDYLFFLDIMPLAIGNAVWVVFWPPTEFRKIRSYMQSREIPVANKASSEEGHFLNSNELQSIQKE